MSESPAIPTPAALRPARPAAVRSVTVAPAPAPSDPAQFGRVDDEGRVFLRAPEGEVLVGQWAAGPPAEGLAFFGRKYDDLVVEIDLAALRLGDGRSSAEQAQAVLSRVREGLAGRSFVGDVTALDGKCVRLEQLIDAARERAARAREEQRAAAAVAREALAAEAEQLAASTSWKATSERYAAIVEEWKALPHAERSREQELWKRISTARAAFDKRRRSHFGEVEAQRKSAMAVKRDLISRAESLAASTDWAGTARRFRDLMTEWRNAPRTSKRDEDRLWTRFKAAQDAFYAARLAAESAQEERLRPNVEAKEQLVLEAEALAVSDHRAAKAHLRSIQDRWEKAGDIPRADRDRLEARLKRVEESVRKAESESWKRSNPEARARAESTASAFADGLAKLEARLAAARSRGDGRESARIESSIEQTRALLQAAQAAAAEFQG
ncbi:MAG: DUF349 domain-containing protein [Actinomycetales bacterium]|nr:DUF349 domain-containing protein [Actinomycetales bacterium]